LGQSLTTEPGVADRSWHQVKVKAGSSMRISSIDEYAAIEPLDDPAGLELIDAQFPYRVVVECDFPEWDVANRWCWQNFGPRHGECSSQREYAACPLI
jgi:hypothetical protein